MPNTSCISGGCHADASGGVFTIAGTLNTTAAGGTPVTGATITITGNDGLVHSMVSGDNGNFFYAAPVAFPATVSVSRCPDVSAMPGTITATGGNCTSCHTSGGAGGGRVHLP